MRDGQKAKIEELTSKVRELEALLKGSFSYDDLSLLNYTHHFGSNSEAYRTVDNFLRWVFGQKIKS